MTRALGVTLAYVVQAVALVLGLAAHAQGQTPAPAAPALNELTATKLENVYLRLAAIQRQQQDAVADLMRLVAQVETDHPGWTWDVQAQRVVAKPTKTEKK